MSRTYSANLCCRKALYNNAKPTLREVGRAGGGSDTAKAKDIKTPLYIVEKIAIKSLVAISNFLIQSTSTLATDSDMPYTDSPAESSHPPRAGSGKRGGHHGST